VNEKKRSTHWLFLIVVLIIALLGVYAYLKITSIKQLQINIMEAKADKIGLTSVRLTFNVYIFNPNVLKTTVNKFHANIHANNIYLTSIKLDEPITIQANEGISHDFTVEISYLDAGAVLFQAIKEQKITWRIEGEYLLALPFGVTYPYYFDIAR
jgi:LEA14-like dessication related protein